MDKLSRLGDYVTRIKAIADNLAADFKTLIKMDATLAEARSELAGKIRQVSEGIRLDHTRRQFEALEKQIRDGLRVLTELGAYEDRRERDTRRRQ